MNDSNPRMMKKRTNAKRKSKPKIKKKTKRPPPPPWMDLPDDIWANILQRIGAKGILKAAQMVCTTWRRVCNDPSMWRVIHIKNYGRGLGVVCRHAVDRSQGGLLDIQLEFPISSELLTYIAERSSKLRRLSLACCYSSVHLGLPYVFQKLPLLEELSLTLTSIDKEGFEALGRYCPLLKSFELNFSFFKYSLVFYEPEDIYENYEALAIAKNLPSLCHLQLIGNKMTSEGLEAILIGCPHLVSLDLRWCLDVNLEKFLSSKYRLQIKDIKYPHYSLADFAYEPPGDDSDEEVETIPDEYDPPLVSSEEENEPDYMYHYSL